MFCGFASAATRDPGKPEKKNPWAGYPTLTGTATINPPKAPRGRVAVVASGPIDQKNKTVPVVVENNTNYAVTRITVAGSARDASGRLVGGGESQFIEPAAIAPGQLAIGYVYFSSGAPPDSTLTFQVATVRSKGPDRDYLATVQVTETNKTVDNSDPEFVKTDIIGTVQNPHNVEMTGPIIVVAVCFDAAGNPTAAPEPGGAAIDTLPPKGTSPFDATFYNETCNSYLVGGSGFNRAAL